MACRRVEELRSLYCSIEREFGVWLQDIANDVKNLVAERIVTWLFELQVQSRCAMVVHFI